MAEQKLSLPTRKNLRDNEEKKKEQLARIAEAIGKTAVEFAIKDDIKVAAQLAKNGYEDRLGEIFYAAYLEQLADSLGKLCANGHAKASLNQKWTSGKIYFELDEKAPTYQNVDFPNGDLRMFCASDRIWSNISSLGDDIPAKLTSDILGVTLPLASAQNIREYEEKAGVHLAAIGTAIGRAGPVAFSVEDVKGVDAQLTTNGYENRIGEVIWDAYLSQLAGKLTSLCADDLTKESIADAFKGNLVFKLDPKAEGYQNCKFEGGNLVMSCKPDKIWTNIDTLGGDIEGQL